ncbi:MAG: DNA ligase, partial [Planctomycetes bacterium]|nr:DNA ligase [Planctomycetota bacterium]
RLGALVAELPDGTQFAVGTGLSDAARNSPPPIGSIITFKYQELTDAGVPRFPSFVGVRNDLPNSLYKGETSMPQTSTKKRCFEFVGRGSNKFWDMLRA